MPNSNKSSRNSHRQLVASCINWLAAMACTIVLCGCSRPLLHKLIDTFGGKKHEKPEVYHEYEGYSPGAKRSTVKEDFNRYYYYIATEADYSEEPEPEIIFRQDYDEIDVHTSFDEEEYWREHPIIVEEETDNNVDEE